MNYVGRLKKWSVLTIVILIFGTFGVCVYQYGGLRQFVKAEKYIFGIQSGEIRDKSQKGFVGVIGDGHYSGIYAGKLFGMVWVWGRFGLRPFVSGQYSAFSFYDGCTGIYLLGNYNSPPIISREVYFDKKQWEQRVKVGDAISVMIPKSAFPWQFKEVFTYNFWPFIQKDQKTACAK